MLSLAAVSAFANLGETPAQICHRYGSVQSHTDISTNRWQGFYNPDNWHTTVVFQDGLSV